MPPEIEKRSMLKQEKFQESSSCDNLFGGISEQNESELKWVELHQMFDR